MSGSRLHPPEGCRCPACAVRAAILLLERGRAAMALCLLRPLPDIIHEQLGMAWARGHDQAVLALRRGRTG